MTNLRDQIKALMHRVRQQGGLPPSADIVAEAFQDLGYVPGVLAPEEVISRFDQLLRNVWENTLQVLERYEEQSYAQGIPRELAARYPDEFEDAGEVAETQGFGAGVIRLFSSLYPALRQCFLSVSQSRKQRDGQDFELQIERLFDLAEVPYDRQAAQSRTDLVLPNLEVFEQNRNISAVVSVKRTLRERWAEVAEELFNLRSPNVFLFTVRLSTA